jgi:hypothetical protein
MQRNEWRTRILLLCGLVALLALTIPTPQYNIQSRRNNQPIHILVIDAGSTGTRITCFDQLYKQTCKYKAKPGLADLALQHQSARKQIKHLLDSAAQHIPYQSRWHTQLLVYATAGLRDLSDTIVRPLLQEVQDEIASSNLFHFDPANLKVIDGFTEAILGWISLNHQLGNILSCAAERESSGMMEMGGGSMQIAFELAENEEETSSFSPEFMRTYQLTIPSCKPPSNSILLKVSSLRFGTHSARSLFVNLLYQSNDLVTSLDDPCLLNGEQIPITFPDASITLFGKGSFSKCLEKLNEVNLTSHILDTRLNSSRRTSSDIDGLLQLPSLQNFYGTREFYFVYDSLTALHNLESFKLKTPLGNSLYSFNLESFRHLAEKFCSKSYTTFSKEIRARHNIETLCFRTAWVFQNLQTFSKKNDKSTFKALHQLNGEEINWSLGAAISHRERTQFIQVA